jgi:hypothetical protein
MQTFSFYEADLMPMPALRTFYRFGVVPLFRERQRQERRDVPFADIEYSVAIRLYIATTVIYRVTYPIELKGWHLLKELLTLIPSETQN